MGQCTSVPAVDQPSQPQTQATKYAIPPQAEPVLNSIKSSERESVAPVQPPAPAVDEAALWNGAALFGSKTSDMWGNLHKACDYAAGVCPASCVSITVLSTSRKFAKVICNTSSPQSGMVKRGELCHISEVPTALQVATSGQPNVIKLGAEATADSRKLGSDYLMLYEQAGCTCFATIPLYHGRQVLGTLLLAGTDSDDPGWPNRWLAAFWPWMAMYLAEVNAVRLVNLLETIQTAPSLNALAWVVISELDTWFEWCHADDTEARLVLLSEDRPTALVLSRSTYSNKSDNNLDSPLNSALRSGQMRSSMETSTAGPGPGSQGSALGVTNSSKPGVTSGTGQRGMNSTLSAKQLLEEGLLGTQMSLVNTLTRRCLAEGSKLLFVADVMAALKKYGEPWKDIFLDQAYVTNPMWVIAAPVMAEGKHLAAIIWLSSSRLSPTMLAQAAKTSVPPLLHCVAEQLQVFINQATRPSAKSGSAGVLEDGVHAWSHILNMRHIDSGHLGLSTTSIGKGIDSLMDLEHRPIKYSIARTDSASTNALMRMYQTAIAQHQRASTSSLEEQLMAGEEIEVIAKAGQGAFGSVYVAMWKGLVVAVKVMKQQQEGRRAMRTAWELAVTKSLQHANVVAVHAVLTDVVVEKRSKRSIRFMPSTPQAVDMASSPLAPSLLSQSTPGVEGAAPPPDPHDSPRCQVIIMEYCNLGPLHHYMAERRFVRQMSLNPSTTEGDTTGAGRGMPPGSPMALSGQLGVSGRLGSGTSPHVGGAAAELQAQWPLAQVDMPMIIATLMEVAEAMAYLHSCGFIHCDLKPENILLKVSAGDSRGFTAKVSDFGLSELFTAEGPLMGELGGTVTHIAPEIVTTKEVSKMCDVYSFGIIMWEMYSGQRPYLELLQSNRDKRLRDKTILSKVAHEGMRPQFAPSSPPDYAQLAQRCWGADPLTRPTFPELLVDLRVMQERYGVPLPCAQGGPPDSGNSILGHMSPHHPSTGGLAGVGVHPVSGQGSGAGQAGVAAHVAPVMGMQPQQQQRGQQHATKGGYGGDAHMGTAQGQWVGGGGGMHGGDVRSA